MFSFFDFFITRRILIDKEVEEILSDEKQKKALFEAIDSLEKNDTNNASAETEGKGQQYKIEVEIVGSQ